jgi:3-hydroxy-9,10-secoandrosta-1,3,5(10)-triene-9,17-dione monooxygenase
MNIEDAKARELIAHARSMIPLLRERAMQDEENRRVSPDTIQEIKRAGFIRVLTPVRWGGFEMSPSVLAEIGFAIAEGDMSASWVYGLYANHAYHVAFYDDRAQKEVWGQNEDALISSSYMPNGRAKPVAGGYELSGRWKFSSGSDHSDWILLGGISADEPTEVISFLVPRSECTIVDTWHVLGLKGSGSHDIVVEQSFVPQHRIYSFSDGFHCRSRGTYSTPLYRLPPFQLFYRVITNPNIGALQAMLDEFVDYAKKRVTAPAQGSILQNSDALLAVGQSIAAIEEMKSTEHHIFSTLLEYGRRGVTPPISERLRYRYQSSLVADICLTNARALFEAAGATGLFEATPLGRIYRNLIAGRQHHGSQFKMFARALGANRLGVENSADVIV